MWYPSFGGGAIVSTYEAGGEVQLDTTNMVKAFGADSMTVILDARNTVGSNYYTGVGVNIAGDLKHLTLGDGSALDGVETITVTDPEGESYEAICWNLSKLVSISIDGKIQGSIHFKLTGANGNSVGVISHNIKSSGDAEESFDKTILVSEFVTGGWAGSTWDAIKGSLYEVGIELDTEGDNLAIIKINSIKFNFASDADKLNAFPFLK